MKNILQLLILSSLIGLSGCQTEELFAEKTTSIYVKKKIAFEEFKKQTGINNLQSSFIIPTNTNEIHAKTANGRYELTDFDIETSQIIRFTNSHNKITFSFKIKPKNKVLLAKENYNLVYHKENNLWEQTIVYFEDIEVNNKTTYSNISRIYQSTNPIVVGSPMISTFNSGGCSYTVSYVECDGTCDPGGPCMGFSCPDGGCVTTVMIFTACGPGGSGDPTNHGDNSENDGNIHGGGDLSFSPNTDLPVFPSASCNPCKMMKELVQPKPDKPSIKPEIDWLKTKVDESHEFGVEVEKIADPETNEWREYTYTQKESQNANELSVNLTVGGRHMAGAHSHPFGKSYAIPSYGDLKWLLDCYDNSSPKRKEFVFSMIVCKDNNGINHVYSLNINNIISFRTKVMEIWNDTKYDGLAEDLKMNRILAEQAVNLKNSNGQIEKSFLEQFKNFGFDLLEATNDNLDEWKKVELSPTATVIKVPCN